MGTIGGMVPCLQLTYWGILSLDTIDRRNSYVLIRLVSDHYHYTVSHVELSAHTTSSTEQTSPRSQRVPAGPTIRCLFLAVMLQRDTGGTRRLDSYSGFQIVNPISATIVVAIVQSQLSEGITQELGELRKQPPQLSISDISPLEPLGRSAIKCFEANNAKLWGWIWFLKFFYITYV